MLPSGSFRHGADLFKQAGAVFSLDARREKKSCQAAFIKLSYRAASETAYFSRENNSGVVLPQSLCY